MTAELFTYQAYRYALHPTPEQTRLFTGHVGAGRFAYNWGLSLVKARLDARAAQCRAGQKPTVEVPWTLPALRREWNHAKHEVAPWWATYSKEAFNSGLDALARALKAWSAARTGKRKGGPVGFPRFRRRGRSQAGVRFTTGAIRVEPDRHHVVLPRLGRVRIHESTRKLARRLEAGTARVLAATVTRRVGRWQVSFTCEVARRVGRPSHIGAGTPVVGVDVGVLHLAVVATPAGQFVEEVANPRAFEATRARLRRLGRRAARQDEGSHRWERTMARVNRVHARAANVRRDTLAKLTTRLAQRHRVVVVETLNAKGMRRAGGARKRGLNRALADAALAQTRRQLAYKTRWYGSTLVEADRWYPSTKTCLCCGMVKTKLSLAERAFTCDPCGHQVDRDLQAATNLARLGDPTWETRPAGSSPAAGRGADRKTRPGPALGAAGGNEASTPPAPSAGTAASQEAAA